MHRSNSLGFGAKTSCVTGTRSTLYFKGTLDLSLVIEAAATVANRFNPRYDAGTDFVRHAIVGRPLRSTVGQTAASENTRVSPWLPTRYFLHNVKLTQKSKRRQLEVNSLCPTCLFFFTLAQFVTPVVKEYDASPPTPIPAWHFHRA